MKHHLKLAMATLVGLAGITSVDAGGLSHAGQAGAAKHFNDIEWQFFTGRGLSSGEEGYATSIVANAADSTADAAPSAQRAEAGTHLSAAEYLFFTGAGFDSLAN